MSRSSSGYELDEVAAFNSQEMPFDSSSTTTSDNRSAAEPYSPREGRASPDSPRHTIIIALSNPYINDVISRQLGGHSSTNPLGLLVLRRTCQLPGNSDASTFQLRFVFSDDLPVSNNGIYRGANAFFLLYHDTRSLNRLLANRRETQILLSGRQVFAVHIKSDVPRTISEADQKRLADFFNAPRFTVKEQDGFPVADVGFAKVFSCINNPSRNPVPPTARVRLMGRRDAVVVVHGSDDSPDQEQLNGGESIQANALLERGTRHFGNH